jgi:hypothetical protein
MNYNHEPSMISWNLISYKANNFTIDNLGFNCIVGWVDAREIPRSQGKGNEFDWAQELA